MAKSQSSFNSRTAKLKWSGSFDTRGMQKTPIIINKNASVTTNHVVTPTDEGEDKVVFNNQKLIAQHFVDVPLQLYGSVQNGGPLIQLNGFVKEMDVESGVLCEVIFFGIYLLGPLTLMEKI